MLSSSLFGRSYYTSRWHRTFYRIIIIFTVRVMHMYRLYVHVHRACNLGYGTKHKGQCIYNAIAATVHIRVILYAHLPVNSLYTIACTLGTGGLQYSGAPLISRNNLKTWSTHWTQPAGKHLVVAPPCICMCIQWNLGIRDCQKLSWILSWSYFSGSFLCTK